MTPEDRLAARRLAQTLDATGRLELYSRWRQKAPELAREIARVDESVVLRDATAHPRRGELLAVKKRDDAGRKITRYYGDPHVWRDQFTARPIGFRVRSFGEIDAERIRAREQELLNEARAAGKI